jgi:GNAT superfamily N-acetyltransferase
MPQLPDSSELRHVLVEAARGRFPPGDLGVEILGPPAGRSDAVVAFSGHNLVAAAVPPDDVRAHLAGDDPGGPMSPPFLTWLGSRLGTEPGSLDVVLAAFADPAAGASPTLVPRTDLDGHDRVRRARSYRSSVSVYSPPHADDLVIVGRGLAGRLEVSLEVDPARRGRGIGASLAARARSLATDGEPIFAQVAPGNVASLRAFLAAGYRPICSEVLFLRRGHSESRSPDEPASDGSSS